jgi:hypothetical protein
MGKADDTLAAILARPVRANIPWRDIEALFKHHGAEITEGRGSRIRVVLNGVKATFHRPHPRREAHKAMVKSVRRFLEEAGIESS